MSMQMQSILSARVINMVQLKTKYILVGICFLLLSGCSSKSFFQEPAKPYTGNIYQISEQAALQLAHSAMQTTFPDEKVMEITSKNRKGFLVIQEVDVTQDTRYARFRAETYSYRVLVLPGIGMNSQGSQVSGFYFETDAQGDDYVAGTKVHGGEKPYEQLKKNLYHNFDQTGTAVAVTSIQAGQYAPASDPYQAPQQTAVTPAPAQQPVATTPAATQKHHAPPVSKPTAVPTQDTFEKLKKLKTLHDQGVITDQEFLEKKKELLDRI